MGTQQAGNEPDGAETVERLVERVITSTLLDDRRDAVRALKALSKKFRLQVGAQGMDALIKVLESDRNVPEIVGLALDTLCNVVSPEPPEDEDEVEVQRPDDLGVQFTEIFMKRSENVTLLLSLLEEFDFSVRWPAVRLLASLLINKPKELQESILVSPMGVSRLMDLLSESREIIRNEALLLLTHLTKGNANIQKIVSFENGFERLLDIIAEEGGSDGGIVVEDCLVLLLSLLKNNTSNQNFFKEGCFIQKLAPFLNVYSSETSDAGWSAQKVSNIHLMLQIIRTLVSPSNPLQVTSACQKVMSMCGLLEQLCNILMASGVPADILTETINTVAEVIRGHHGNQEYFASVTAPCNPPRPAIVVLLMSMVNEKQPFILRCAVLYCFQCFLYKNEVGQAQIVQTLLPTSVDVGTVTAGHLLCGGLVSSDPLSNWFVAVALMHALVDSTTQKEHLLRVQLVTRVGGSPIFLMQQLTSMLLQGGKVQTRIGLLMLLSTWLANCPLAVTHFLNVPTNVPYLISQVVLTEGDELEVLVQGLCAFLFGICVQFNDDSVPTFSKDALCNLIAKRVGIETYSDKLSFITKHESYSQAAHKPQMKHQNPSELLFDYEFCRLFKSLEGAVIKAVTPKSSDSILNGPETNLTEAEHGLLQQYKGLIRDQDQQLSELRIKLSDLQSEHSKLLAQIDEMGSSIQQLKDQNSLLKAQRGSFMSSSNSDISSSPGTLKEKLEGLQAELDSTKQALEERNQLVESLRSLHVSDAPVMDDNELGRLNAVIAKQRDEIENLKQLNVRNEQEKIAQGSATAMTLLADEKRTLEEQLLKLNEKSQKLEQHNEGLEKEKFTLKTELEALKKEQDDLLMLLTEQETKLDMYKKRLKELGDVIEDDFDDGKDEDENVDIE